jgi:ABC-2 type transport system permease protein
MSSAPTSSVSPWRALAGCVRKELLLLTRDLHGLALLFLMPLAFVVIMSLALQNQFAEQAGNRLKLALLDLDGSSASQSLAAALKAGGGFEILSVTASDAVTGFDRKLQRGDYALALEIRKGFGDRLLAEPGNESPPLQVHVAPDTGQQIEALFVGNLRAALGRERMRAMLALVGRESDVDAESGANADGIAIRYAYRAAVATGKRPTSVQQSVPAWLVFGAFFVAIPLSNTLVRERQQGTLRRLRSTNLAATTLLLGKFIPYFAVNVLQVFLMLMAGRFLVPSLGGDTLYIDCPVGPLLLMSAALSVAAIGLALLVAVISRTTEQATLISGTGNILLAALGGIMVPKFIMPQAMQSVASLSPMSWGLEGFLDLLLRAGSWTEIGPEAAALAVLGAAAMVLAGILYARRHD